LYTRESPSQADIFELFKFFLRCWPDAIWRLLMMIDGDESMQIGERAGEHVHPDPVVPTVGAN
jgi:hypothetical protein